MRNKRASNSSLLEFLRSLPVVETRRNRARLTERERYITTGPALKDLRLISGLTQSQSAKLSLSTLEEWRGFESGRVPMHPAIYKTFIEGLTALKGWPDLRAPDRASVRRKRVRTKVEAK